MQIVRTVIWVLLLVGLLLFSIANWDPTVTVRIWDGIVVDTKIPAIVIVSFLIGFVPMWLYHRGSKWKSQRKIASLENAARTAAATPVVAPTAGASADTQVSEDATVSTATPSTKDTTVDRDPTENELSPDANPGTLRSDRD
ncbi:LapA family protein [Aurantiacibacter aquimixticola]|uniref:LapA family protein n=1 Tax=Aurantiacibacter aquimixticola TaxID=1958945 RepID=A0A419RSR9_9SPHN|nr:LapA family protein [Aurantiacibacter aquimixticola]RJY08828.1 LapA family protein [Aurantiacibacter aquimixticola]